MTSLALYEPEIAGNVGAIIRLCVCFDLELHIIEPCGFPFDMKRIKKSALDYIDHARITRHNSFDEFYENEITKKNQRLILATTKGSVDYSTFEFQKTDVILFGKESAGVPDSVHEKADAKIFIKMQNNMRSLNIALSCAIIAAKSIL